MKKTIELIFQQQEFIENPPVLIDIGASGALNKDWKLFAKYCICIAFDADNREMQYIVKETSNFKKLYVFNSIVSDSEGEHQNFYLTKSPYCSSLLKPDTENLDDYIFSASFEVDSEISLKNTNISKVLATLNINYIDWFKTDSQGTDLRLFKSVDSQVINNTLVADFEPGIIKAYTGEDKLFNVLSFMDSLNFWVSNAEIKTTYRIKSEIFRNKLSKNRKKLISLVSSPAPGWCEITYFNDFKIKSVQSKRNIMLGWIFAMSKKQFGFALELADLGTKIYGDGIFLQLEEETLRNISFTNISLKKVITLAYYKVMRTFNFNSNS